MVCATTRFLFYPFCRKNKLNARSELTCFLWQSTVMCDTTKRGDFTEIQVIEPKKKLIERLRVCAYCRVSTEEDEQENSLENKQHITKKQSVQTQTTNLSGYTSILESHGLRKTDRESKRCWKQPENMRSISS